MRNWMVVGVGLLMLLMAGMSMFPAWWKKVPAMAQQVEGGCAHLGQFDRVGYVRVRKSGSTTFANTMLGRLSPLGLRHCECLGRKRVPMVANCLYRNLSLQDQACGVCSKGSDYPCTHFRTTFLHKFFNTHISKLETEYASAGPAYATRIPEIRSAKLHLITLLRHPVYRALSEFFYVREGCKKKMWENMYTKAQYADICAGNVEKVFLEHPSSLVERQVRMFTNRRNIDRDTVESDALPTLANFTVVLFTEDLPEGLRRFQRCYGKAGAESDFSIPVARPTVKDALYKSTLKNGKLLQKIESLNQPSVDFYETAFRLYSSNPSRLPSLSPYRTS
mmetsp:Transcript_1989/g.5515  ORF Transcript_1989/g.5515 Transcript_1989/m.5515 type:complete len:335 (-) Transcript_1989:115-1119(-)